MVFCNWSNWSGLLLNFLSAISCVLRHVLNVQGSEMSAFLYLIDMYICTALFKHFTVLSAYCLFYDIQVRPMGAQRYMFM